MLFSLVFIFTSRFRTALEHHFSTKDNIPIVLVALNGGPNTIKTLVEGINTLN
jgi:hypothetical protein